MTKLQWAGRMHEGKLEGLLWSYNEGSVLVGVCPGKESLKMWYLSRNLLKYEWDSLGEKMNSTWKAHESRRSVYVRDSQENWRLEQKNKGTIPENGLEGSVEMGHLNLGCSSWYVDIKPFNKHLASTMCHHCYWEHNSECITPFSYL